MSDFEQLKDTFVAILGEENLLTSVEDCAFYSQDVFSVSDITAKAVLRPGSIEELSKVVTASTEAGYAIFPRGGGMSYTGGYLPTREKSVMIDMERMNRILVINQEDMFVTVEAGCTWAQLHDALKDIGLRSQFWGTLSGLKATIGGGVSQNSLFFGSGLYNTTAESVLGLEVVTANGGVIRTGSASIKGGTPFFRNYGPDLTGVFLGDTGALGIKATVTLKLIKNPKYREFGSFSFDHYEDMMPAMSEISRRGLVSECFGFDPYLQAQRMKRESIAKDVKSFAGVLKASDGIMDAVKKGTKLAVAGRGYMKDVIYSFHATSENKSKEAAVADMAEVREIALAAGGKEIENSIPTLVNANPFMPLNTMIGPAGERWAPVHGIAPHSKIVELQTAAIELFDKHREKIDEYNVGIGFMYLTIGSSASLLEPVFFWEDALHQLHKESVEKSHLDSLKGFEENLEIRTFVAGLRQELIGLFKDFAAVHLQIGKTYPYRDAVATQNFALVKAIKNHTDPDNLINPGSLGL